MKNFSFILIIIISCTTLWGCEKEDEINLSGPEYLIFGHFYGECMGESCVEIFRLETNRLLEDTNDFYPSHTDYYEGNYTELSKSKFNLVKDLLDYFPEDLLNENNKRIGEPDAGDWGGLYIEYNYDGKRQFWLIDQKKSNVPGYLHDFIDKVNENIAMINN